MKPGRPRSPGSKTTAVGNTLRSCRLFTGRPPPDLQNPAAVTVVKSLAKDEYLFHEGDPAQGFYSESC